MIKYTELQTKTQLSTLFAVSVISAIVNTSLAVLKIVVGIIGHSQALIADGIHSFSDLLTDALVVIAGYMGLQSPDKEHPYGHRRIETIGTIIISGVLITVGLGITYDTLQHFIHPLPSSLPTFPVILVAIISIIANEALFRYTLTKGNQTQSDLLRANAWHNRSDALVSLVVLISVIGVHLGFSYLDSIGALVIAFLILKMSFKMIGNNIKELIDTGVDDNTLKLIYETISDVPGVLSVHQLRTRSHGNHIFIDVHIQVSPDISVSEGHYISEQVHLSLLEKIPEVTDVTVHIDPENDALSAPSPKLPNRQEVYKLFNLYWEHLPGYKEIRRTILHYLNGKLRVEIYLPLSAIEIKKDFLESQYQNAIQKEKIIEKVTIYFE